MAEDILLLGGRLIDPASGRDEEADVRIHGSKVAEVGPDLSRESAVVIDVRGLVVAPGFVDLHTHLREPGREDEETVASGSLAAAMGGFTAISAMANTDPVADSAGIVEQVWNAGRAAGLCDVYPVGAITIGLEGEKLAEMGEMVASAAHVNFFSDDGRCVNDSGVMRRALEYARAFDAIVANHAEDRGLAEGGHMNEGEISAMLGLTGIPSEAEEVVVLRDLALARLTGSRLHIPHVSTAGSVEAIRAAKARGVRVTAEATPHHLTLTDDLVCGYDPVFKVAPPLRSRADVEALRAGLADQTIDCVATDHAPHSPEEKEREFDKAPCGMTGLETAFAAVLTESGLSLPVILHRMSTAPARIRGFAGQGGPVVQGAAANLVVLDPAAVWTVDPARGESKSVNSPFAGRRLNGAIVHTIYRGKFTVKEGRPANGQG